MDFQGHVHFQSCSTTACRPYGRQGAGSIEEFGSIQASAQLIGKQYELSDALQPGAASVACMLGAAYTSQRLRLLSTLIIQQRTQAADAPTSSPSGCEDCSASLNNQVKDDSGPALSSRLCLEAAEPAAAEPQGTDTQQPVSSLQLGQPGSTASPQDVSHEAVPALTRDEKLRAQRSMSMLRATDSRVSNTLQITEVCLRPHLAFITHRVTIAGPSPDLSHMRTVASQHLTECDAEKETTCTAVGQMWQALRLAHATAGSTAALSGYGRRRPSAGWPSGQ